MEIKTYPMKVAEGKVYTEITLRDVVERCDVSDLPMLAEIKRLYDENAKLRELCATVIDDWMSKVCPSFPFCECGGEYQDCTDETCGNQIYRQMARELGVDDV